MRDLAERLRGKAEAWRAAADMLESIADDARRRDLMRHAAEQSEAQADRIDSKEG